MPGRGSGDHRTAVAQSWFLDQVLAPILLPFRTTSKNIRVFEPRDDPAEKIVSNRLKYCLASLRRLWRQGGLRATLPDSSALLKILHQHQISRVLVHFGKEHLPAI